MAFLCFLLVTATLFLRPAEIFPAVSGMPIYEGLMLGCLIGYRREILEQFRGQRLQQQPITLCALLLFVAIALSHATHLYLYGMRLSLDQYLRTLAFYLILVGCVNSVERMQSFLKTVALSASLMVLLCVVDYVGLVDFEFVTHIEDREGGTTITNEEVFVTRMRGTGIFEDPNDICLVINAAGVLCVYFLTQRGGSALRFAWLIPLIWLGAGLLFTHSRGGLLSTAAAGVALLSCRYDQRIGIVSAILGAVALPLVGGRQGSIDLEDGTGQDRIQLWADGFDSLRSPDLLCGIGMNEYADMAGLVAHNSFVHAYTELGVFGGTWFFGMFFFAGLGLYRFALVRRTVHDSRLLELHPFIAAVLVAWTVGLMSLSRCYVVPTYLMLGTMTTFINLAPQSMLPSRLLLLTDRGHVINLLGSSATFFMGLFLFTKLFARWG